MESSVMKTIKSITTACLIGAALVATTAALAAERTTGRGTGPIIYVTSQGLFYDSIVVVDPLPMKGNFQQLIPGMNGLSTEFGPGEVGHLGGRWWVDVDGGEVMDAGDHYFLCPLLGPGRAEM
jgi:hypothetical protein